MITEYKIHVAYYKWSTGCTSSNALDISFFQKKKHLDFLSWCEIANLFISGKVNHKELISKAITIRNEMNDKRKVFTWDHLKDFYSI